jgi:hypothetical protein
MSGKRGDFSLLTHKRLTHAMQFPRPSQSLEPKHEGGDLSMFADERMWISSLRQRNAVKFLVFISFMAIAFILVLRLL